MGVDSKMSVCVCVCVSVCNDFVPKYLLNGWSDWDNFFFAKTRENVYLGFLILGFRGHRPRVKALG